MKKMRILSVLIAALFLFSVVLPPALAEEAGDKLAEIFKKDIKPTVDLLPVGIEVVEGFEPGEGDPIGSVEKAVGQVLVFHPGDRKAYVLEKGTSLFTGDTLISAEKSSLYSKLNDKSEFTLAAYSKIVLDKSIYDPDKNSRDSLLSLMFGKARFIVEVLSKETQEDYKVKTPTAVLGVRGSDFALSVVPVDALTVSRSSWIEKLGLIGIAHAAPAGPSLVTTLVTGEKTTVGFAGTVGPTQIVGPLQLSQAIAGMAAIAPMTVSAAVVIGAIGGASGAAGAAAGGSAAAISTTTIAVVAGGVAAAGAVAASSSSSSDDSGSGEFTIEESTWTCVTTSVGGTCPWSSVGDTHTEHITPTATGFVDSDGNVFTHTGFNTYSSTTSGTGNPPGSGTETWTTTLVLSSNSTGTATSDGAWTPNVGSPCTWHEVETCSKTGP